MIQTNSGINLYLNNHKLPYISYRISANYGRVDLAILTNSNIVDLFGPAVNICSKINSLALPNEMVIYKDLYNILEKNPFLRIIVLGGGISKCQMNIKQNVSPYMVYSVNRVEGSLKRQLHQYNQRNEVICNKNQRESIKQIQNIQSKINSSYNILIIDDSDDIIYTLNAFLKLEGYNTVSYSDPLKAWACFSRMSPYYFDLIITDIRMREINGIKLYFKFKAINPEIKILFLSAHDAIEELISVLPDIKTSDVFRKPIQLKYLVSKIKTILSQD